MARFVKATEEQRNAYKGARPLAGFVSVKGEAIPVEVIENNLRSKLRDCHCYEAVAPEGFQFYPTGHTILRGWTQKGLSTLLSGCSIVSA